MELWPEQHGDLEPERNFVVDFVSVVFCFLAGTSCADSGAIALLSSSRHSVLGGLALTFFAGQDSSTTVMLASSRLVFFATSIVGCFSAASAAFSELFKQLVRIFGFLGSVDFSDSKIELSA